MSLTLQGAQVDIGDAFEGHIVKRQRSFDMNGPPAILKIGSTQIGSVPVQTKSNFRSSPGLHEFDVDVVSVNSFFE
ncbi:MAG TPA: hypothetical protein VHA33_19565 [Candidatus Angelobacter sp.]|nr:hypothetical protein [Candidatus Angelobacter sp.]